MSFLKGFDELPRFRFYAYAFILICVASLFAKTDYIPGNDLSFDAFYHVTMADLFSDAALSKTFPWTQFSVWRDCFYDKELGFHFVLSVYRRWMGMLGFTGNPPFLPETALLIIIYVCSVAWSLKRLGVRREEAFVVAAVLLSPIFFCRLSEVRPHVLAIAIVVIAATTFAVWDGRRLAWGAFVLGFIMAYFYSNPHFVIFPAVVFAMMRMRILWLRAWLPAGLATLGVIAGLTAHPQFPNTFVIWKIQCVDVVWQALTGSAVIETPAELRRPVPILYLYNSVTLAVAIIGAFLLSQADKSSSAEGLPGSSFPARYFAVLSVLSAAGFVLSIRSVEYGLPFTVIAIALAVKHLYGERGVLFHNCFFAVTLLVCLLQFPFHLSMLGCGSVRAPSGFAEWCRMRIPAGACVANLYWDDFPQLFFAMPEYRFMYGMDPMFTYAADPERHRRLNRICDFVDASLSRKELRSVIGTNFVFLSARYRSQARIMACELRLPLVYQGVDGWCFDLDLQPVSEPRGIKP